MFLTKNSNIPKISPRKLNKYTQNSRKKLKTQGKNSKLKENSLFSGISENNRWPRCAQKKSLTQYLTQLRRNSKARYVNKSALSDHTWHYINWQWGSRGPPSEVCQSGSGHQRSWKHVIHQAQDQKLRSKKVNHPCSGYITGKPRQRPSACVACRCSHSIKNTLTYVSYVVSLSKFARFSYLSLSQD